MASSGKIIAILQPVYLPWLGYFEQIARADHFVFLDDVQYTRQDWRNRNRIKTATGSIWLTVPIRRRSLKTLIRDVEINAEQDWPRRHLRSIEQSYSKCPHFQPFFGDVTGELRQPPRLLADLDCRLIRLVCRYLEINTPTSFSSEVPRTPRPLCGASQASEIPDRNQRLIDICEHLGAQGFYEGSKGRSYIDTDRFRRAGIEVVFQSFQHPSYRQAFGRFLPYQSAIDLIMNAGPEAPAIVRSSPLPEPFCPGVGLVG